MLQHTAQTLIRRSPDTYLAAHRPAAAVRVEPSRIENMGTPMTFARNTEIYGENEPADYFYKILSGSVRTSRILTDGRRQIGAFYFPGDVFGLEAGDDHAFAAEAICNARILVIRRSVVATAAACEVSVAQELWMLTGRELQRAQAHLMLLVKTAQERVAGFLLEMAARAHAAREFDLPMSRQDIADYLGLTIETVSRIFTGLEGSATIGLPTSRHVVLRDPAALRLLNS